MSDTLQPQKPDEPTVAEASAPEEPRSLIDYPATYLLIGINLLLFFLMLRSGPMLGLLRQHEWWSFLTAPFGVDLLVKFGGSDSNAVLGGQWWRLLTATFIHVNVLHILLNLWALWNLGFFAEPLLGKRGFVCVYMLTGIAGNMLSLAWSVHADQNSIVAGASGSIFGIIGILLVLLSNRGLGVPWEELRKLRLMIATFALLNIAVGFFPYLLPHLPGAILERIHLDLAKMPRIDNSAHIGGLISGFVLGLPLFPRMLSGRAAYRQRQRVTYAAAALILSLLGYAMAKAATST